MASKKATTKPPKSRPAATAAISQPSVTDTASISALNDNASYFAYISLAVDKHRLRVYDTSLGHSIAEHVFDTARVTSLLWARVVDTGRTDESPKKKRKKKATDQAADAESVENLLLGLSDGTVVVFSPTHGRAVRVLGNTKSTTAILALTIDKSKTLFTSGADASIRQWDLVSGNIAGSWKSDDRIPYTALAVRTTEEDTPELLAAHHAVHLLSLEDKSASKLATFPGHASPIRKLLWVTPGAPSQRFVSMAENDRVVSIWEVPRNNGTDGKLVASIQLDADVRSVALQDAEASSTLLTLSTTGRISICPIPSELNTPPNAPQKIATLLPRSTIAVPPSKNRSGVLLVGAGFCSPSGSVEVVRLVGGVKPVFDRVGYTEDATQNFIREVSLEDVSSKMEVDSTEILPNKRYTEANSVAVGSGVDRGHAPELDDATRGEGELDADMAELSLGQRLTALNGNEVQSASDDEDGTSKSKRNKSKTQTDVTLVPAASLTRTLIQALHSSDSRLMETCLAHSDTVLIRNTIRALPPQLAVALLTACTERLGRGARAANMKGGGGGASSQRGAALIAWIKIVLTIHSGHLMTMPDLVARLSGLHATLTSRLALQESLLSLSGRLDMVLSQIEMRSSTIPAALTGRKSKPVKTRNVKKYVEGESESEDEGAGMEVEVEVGSDDEGSVEDVELGGESSEEDEEEEGEEDDEEEDDDDEEDEEEDDEDSDGPVANGFIDDEAEDEFSDEESDGSE
ncbi:NUC189-domain-containing protein, partial [Cylindrobasidium torrendii FP15055 ss-10]